MSSISIALSGFTGVALVFFCLMTSLAAADDRDRKGAESVQIGGATEVFDQVEFDSAFQPQDQGQAWQLIERGLGQLAIKLPATGKYLLSFFGNGRLVWWFVRAKLKPSNEGETNVFITVEKQQAGLNSEDSIQIQRSIWDNLNDEGRATLMMNLMLWTAAEPDVNRESIRLLGRYLLHPNLGTFSAVNIASFIQKRAKSSSKLFGAVALDIQSTSSMPMFRVDTITVGARDFQVATVTAGFLFRGMQLTPLRPNPNYVVYFAEWDPRSQLPALYASDRSSQSDVPLTPKMLSQINYAGFNDWRLPTAGELELLKNLNVLDTRSIEGRFFENPLVHFFKWPVNEPPSAKFEESHAAFLNSNGQLTYFDNPVSVEHLAVIKAEDIPYFLVRETQ
jgi:hypothetical protein